MSRSPGGDASPPVRERPSAGRARLTKRRLLGLDRSGPPPPQTLSSEPWRPWTIPNAIGYVRLALIPLFLWLAFRSPDGRDAAAAIVFGVIAWSDYLDGMAARVTGQYSRLGAVLDPVVDRLLVVSGFAVCWGFELLPRWALAAAILREVAVAGLAQYGLHRGLELRINWPGRLGVFPTMSAPFFAMVGLLTAAEVLLYAGLVLGFLALALYARRGLTTPPPARTPPPAPSS